MRCLLHLLCDGSKLIKREIMRRLPCWEGDGSYETQWEEEEEEEEEEGEEGTG